MGNKHMKLKQTNLIKNYKELGHKEFFNRWKEGIAKVSPLAQAQSTLLGTFIIVLGTIIGIISAIIYKQWWLLVIMIGSLIVSGTSLLGSYQKVLTLQNLEKLVREVENNNGI